MDYFKSLSSAASSVLSSARSGPLPNITIGSEVGEYRQQTLWSLYSAVKRDDSTPCTVLAFDLSHPHNASRANLLPLAKNAVRKLRTTRHPDVLKLLDSAETASSVYIAVEKATPLYKVLAQSDDKRATPQRQDLIVWGLSSIVAFGFSSCLRWAHRDQGRESRTRAARVLSIISVDLYIVLAPTELQVELAQWMRVGLNDKERLPDRRQTCFDSTQRD